jgi:phosphatidate phosphatase APP1
MFGPLYDYFITGPGAFPEGTFHLGFYPTNPFSKATLAVVSRFIAQMLKLTTESTLDLTYEHKIKQITAILDHFPQRKFILVGDSGEVDPEVYREIRDGLRQRRPTQQIQSIIIRDVINDNEVNPYRLQDMELVKVTPVCIEDQHFRKLARVVQKAHPRQMFRKNSEKCGEQYWKTVLTR